MNLSGNDTISLHSSMPAEDDVLIKKLLLTHDPDGRYLDSELLLRAIKNVLRCVTTSQVCNFHVDGVEKDDISDIEVVGSQETLAQIIYKVKTEMLRKCSGKEKQHRRTMMLFDLLGNYKWDAKLVLILAAFATTFGECCLIMQLHPYNPLAISVAMLKQLPSNLGPLKPQFKALSLLVKTVVDVTKCVMEFEGLPFRHAELDDERIAITKSCIYVAAYWVTRSILACSSQIRDLKPMKPECSNSPLLAAWELSSLTYRLSSICSHLRQQMDLCHKQIEMKLHQKLLDIFQEAYADNQEVLDILLASKDELPLKKSSGQAKLGISKLKDKVLLLLISKPELLPLEGLLLLVDRTYDHPHHKKLEGSYEILWISISDTWTEAERDMFNFLSNSLPWYSVRQPWALNSATVNYIKQAWNYEHESLIVVLDSQGVIRNPNAMDMVLIWGLRAYPFTSSREKELWEEENWTLLQLLVDEIDPLLSTLAEEGRNICIYGSNSLNWIREFNAISKVITSAGVELELVYVGCKDDNSEQVKQTLTVINEEMYRNLFTMTKLCFFWLRWESIRRSILRQASNSDSDSTWKEVSDLLDSANEGWAIIGGGNTKEVVKLSASKATECLNKFPEWEEKLTKLGFVSALRAFLDPPPPGPCNHSILRPFAEGLIEGTVLCDKCKRPMNKYVIYE